MTRFDDTLNYSSVNEDWRTEAQALQLGTADRCLCITGSGDRPLDLLADTAAEVVAIDRVPAQNELLRLKIAALRDLPFHLYTAFLGLEYAPPPWRLEVLRTLDLQPSTRRFWEARPAAVRGGVLYAGRFERHFRRVARLARLIRPGFAARLLCFDDLEAQRRFVASRWNCCLWRWAFRVVCHPLPARLLYGDPAFYAHVQVDPGTAIHAAMGEGLQRCLARESFMAGLVLAGALPRGDLPPYLEEKGAARIRARLDHLRIVDGDLLDHLGCGDTPPYTRLSLSDVPSYLDRDGFRRLLLSVLRRAPTGARLVIRQFLTRYEVPGDLSHHFRRDLALETRLAREDRAFAYRFLVAEVSDG